ncbi:hypothetical protein ACFVFN_37275, partial [Streptomyces pharetrae]
DRTATATVLARVEAGLPGVQATPDDGGRVRVDYPTGRYTSRQVLTFLLDHFDLADWYAPEPGLEDVLRKIYGRPHVPGHARDGAA